MPTRILTAAVLAIFLTGVASVPPAVAEPRRNGNSAAQQQGGLTAKEAAAQAKARYGGKVLKVTPAGKGYKVRLLQDSGRVITVKIGG